MNNDELRTVLKNCLDETDQDLFKIYDVDRVNHKPHPFMIGPRHVAHAADNHSGMLGEKTLEAIPCAMPRCELSYHEHTSNLVVFLQLQRDGEAYEANEILGKLAPVLEENKIEGVVFVDTEEQFRINQTQNNEENELDN